MSKPMPGVDEASATPGSGRKGRGSIDRKARSAAKGPRQGPWRIGSRGTAPVELLGREDIERIHLASLGVLEEILALYPVAGGLCVAGELGVALGEAIEKGIPVVMSTRVPRGEVAGVYGGAGGGATLASKGVIGSTYFRSGQARVLLAIAVATGVHPATLF